MALWDVSQATYSGRSLNVGAVVSSPSDAVFSSDGLKLFVLGVTAATVYVYTLTTAWKVDTASYSGVSFSVSAQDAFPWGLTFKPDGTKMYVSALANGYVYQYTLTTAWDVSTASYANISVQVFAGANPVDLVFSPDGTKMYVADQVSDTIKQFTLSTAWNVGTASDSGKSVDLSSAETQLYDLAFVADGSVLLAVGAVADAVKQINLTTPWDLATGALTSYSLSVSAQETASRSLCTSPAGHRLYVLGGTNSRVYEYTMPSLIAAVDAGTLTKIS